MTAIVRKGSDADVDRTWRGGVCGFHGAVVGRADAARASVVRMAHWVMVILDHMFTRNNLLSLN